MVSTSTDRKKSTVHVRISGSLKAEIDQYCTERIAGIRQATDEIIRAGLKALAEKKEEQQTQQ